MIRHDMCYFEHEEGICVFEDDCPHRDEDLHCLAEDQDLLTYEDYLQWKQNRNLHRTPTGEDNART